MRRALFIVAMAGAAVTRGQPPAILQNGIFNSASRMPTPLPGGFIAGGARFTIRGVRLGSDVRITTVTVQAGARSFRARLLAVNPREIEAILPRAVPTGEATITVSREGETSRPFPIRVA